MKIFDSHTHLFNERVIENVAQRKGLVKRLNLQTQGADQRMGIDALDRSLASSGVTGGLVLPTAGSSDVSRTNSQFIENVSGHPLLHTAGTLHPDDPNSREEIDRLCRHGIRAIKLCSFSQGFVLDGKAAQHLFALLQHHNETCSQPFFVILDTLYLADQWFGTDPIYSTTPEKISTLVKRFPGINFVGAHMGGLSAPFEEIWTWLTPCDNLYLDTSNAAHTLAEEEFIDMLKRFGPGHILFGTDWPWFVHPPEIECIRELTEKAGFGPLDQEMVFYGNITRLLGLE